MRKMRSFRRTVFLVVFLLMIILMVAVSLFAYTDALSIMTKEAKERTRNTAAQMQSAYDIVFRQLFNINYYNSLNVNAQAFMNSDVPTMFFSDVNAEFYDLTGTHRFIQSYISDIGFYASEDGYAWITGADKNNAIPVSDYVDNVIFEYIDSLEANSSGTYFHKYGGRQRYVMTLIKTNKEGTGAAFLSISLKQSKLSEHVKKGAKR